MSGSFEITPALARSMDSRRPVDAAILAAIESGDSAAYNELMRAIAPAAFKRPYSPFAQPNLTRSLIGPRGETQRQKKVRDRAASCGRRRTMGGCGALPHQLRAGYTEGERSVLSVIGLEVKRHGFCDWPIDKIAAVAGVSRRLVQYTLRTAETNAHINVQQRRVTHCRSKTNIITIVAAEWLTWLKRGPSLDSINRSVEVEGGGCNRAHSMKKGILYSETLLRAGAIFGDFEPSRAGEKGLRNGSRWRGSTSHWTGRR